MHVAGHGVTHSELDLRGRQIGGVQATTLDVPGHTAPDHGADQHQRRRAQVLQPLGDGDRAVVQLLHHHTGTEVLAPQPLDSEPAEVQVTLEELADSADEHGDVWPWWFSHRRTSRC